MKWVMPGQSNEVISYQTIANVVHCCKAVGPMAQVKLQAGVGMRMVKAFFSILKWLLRIALTIFMHSSLLCA